MADLKEPGAWKVYKRDADFMQESRERMASSRIIYRAKEHQWGKSGHRPNSKSVVLVDESTGFNAKTVMSFLGEIPPEGKSDSHRHNCEAIIYIVKGKGYTILNEARYDWEENDSLFIPPNAWHQHFNSSSKDPAWYYAVTTLPLLKSMDIFEMEGSKEEKERLRREAEEEKNS